MISEKIQKAINKQINAELNSAYLYLAMSAYFESINMRGMAQWMQEQVKEEQKHAMKFYGYLVEKGGRVSLEPLDKPKSDWKSPLNAFEEAYGHELKITGLINELVNSAQSDKDHATAIMLQWFVSEQVEEESVADAIVQKLRLIKDSVPGLMFLDAELGKRGSK